MDPSLAFRCNDQHLPKVKARPWSQIGRRLNEATGRGGTRLVLVNHEQVAEQLVSEVHFDRPQALEPIRTEVVFARLIQDGDAFLLVGVIASGHVFVVDFVGARGSGESLSLINGCPELGQVVDRRRSVSSATDGRPCSCPSNQKKKTGTYNVNNELKTSVIFSLPKFHFSVFNLSRKVL